MHQPPESGDPVSVSDPQLVERLRRGDFAAFEQIFVTYHAMLCEIADAYVDSQAIAEELVQDLFYALWHDRARLDVRQSLRSYLCRATRNRALQHLRHGSVVLRHARHVAADPDARHTPPSDDGIEQQETLAALRLAVAALPPRGRLAVVLRWRHGMSNAEVSESMGISVKGVEKLLASAMVRLREAMRSHRDPR
jgi:RNA polymerase sigma-70 factor, ECF subfamily